jgi:hypothetical protein
MTSAHANLIPILAAAVLAATPPYKVGTGLDCALGFDALVRAAIEEAGTRPTRPPDHGRFVGYFNERTETAYTVSRPSAVGHPALVKQQIENRPTGRVLVTSACGYGDRGEFDQLIDGVQDVARKHAAPAQ